MTVPRPTGAGIENFTIVPDLLKTRTVDPPNVPVTRRNRAAVSHQREARPRNCDLGGPSAVQVVAFVQRAVYMHCVTETGAIPIEKSPPLATRMYVTTDAVEHQRPLRL